jgi:hypothetical protein
MRKTADGSNIVSALFCCDKRLGMNLKTINTWAQLIASAGVIASLEICS